MRWTEIRAATARRYAHGFPPVAATVGMVMLLAAAAILNQPATYRLAVPHLSSDQAISSYDFSPDGTMLVTGLDDGTMTVRSVADGSLLQQLRAEGSKPPTIYFSADSQELIATTEHQGVRWSTDDWRVVGYAANFGDIEEWQVAESANFSELSRSPFVNATRYHQLSFGLVSRAGFRTHSRSADQRVLVSGFSGGLIEVWNTIDRSRSAVFSIAPAEVTELTVSPDGRSVAVAGSDGSIRLWYWPTRRLLARFDDAAADRGAMSFGADGLLFAYRTADRHLRVLWDGPSQRPLLNGVLAVGVMLPVPALWWLHIRHRAAHRRRLRPARPVTFQAVRDAPPVANCGTFAVHEHGRPARRDTYQPWEVWLYHRLDRAPRVLAVLGSLLLLIACVSLTIEPTYRRPASHLNVDQPVKLFAFSPDSTLLAVIATDGRLTVRSVADGRVLHRMVFRPHPPKDIIFSATGEQLIVSFPGGGLRLTTDDWQVVERTDEYRTVDHWRSTEWFDRLNALRSSSVDFGQAWRLEGNIRLLDGYRDHVLNPDQRVIAGAVEGGRVLIWSVTSALQVASTVIAPAEVSALAVRPDGRAVAIVADDGTLRLWQWSRNQILTQERVSASSSLPTFSPDGNLLAVLGPEQQLRVFWDGPPRWPLIRAGLIAGSILLLAALFLYRA